MLEVRSLSHTYANGTQALRDITMTVPPGLYGLLGPNGAGKSTLMRCLATLQQPTQGEIRFQGFDVLADPQALRQRLGFLPQDFGVYPRVSAYDLLDHLALLKGLVRAGERREAVERLLVQVNLWAVRKKAVAGFSGGMRQRFGVAQALIGQPELIIVDEPTAGLDPEERNRFNQLLCEVGQARVVILSTHLVDDVTDLCAQAAIIAGGRIVAQGAPADLVRSLQSSIWSTVAASTAALAELRQRHDVISTRLRGGQTLVHVRADHAPGAGFEAVTPTLEDYYFACLKDARASQGAPA